MYKKVSLVAGLAAVALSGCSTMQAGKDQSSASGEEFRKLQMELQSKEKLIQSYRDNDLLPPNAKPGECYARVWVPASYRKVTKKILVQAPSEDVKIIPAKYRWAEERVMVKAASSKIKTIPAVYATEKERVLVKAATRSWKTDLGSKATPASQALLATAKAHGIDLNAAKPGMCYHEHYRPAKYTTEARQVEVAQASVGVTAIPAKYRWVDKKVMVKEATSEVRDIPAEYTWAEEKVIHKPAHTVWQKGTGPIQKIDEATGEIMCLVEVPATYKTIRKRVVKTPARTERVQIPAEYKIVKVRELLSTAKEQKSVIPAKYKTLNVRKQVAEPAFVWHEVHDRSEPSSTRTGVKICLVEEPAKYSTVVRKVVKKPASSRTIDIPAEYKTVKVRRQVSAPQEQRVAIPAKYKTVTSQELQNDGHMEWRSILCETNMTVGRISAIQAALKNAGFNPGPVDGVIGTRTIQAINAFQRDKRLPVDKYINLKTLKALGVSAR